MVARPSQAGLAPLPSEWPRRVALALEQLRKMGRTIVAPSPAAHAHSRPPPRPEAPTLGDMALAGADLGARIAPSRRGPGYDTTGDSLVIAWRASYKLFVARVGRAGPKSEAVREGRRELGRNRPGKFGWTSGPPAVIAVVEPQISCVCVCVCV